MEKNCIRHPDLLFQEEEWNMDLPVGESVATSACPVSLQVGIMINPISKILQNVCIFRQRLGTMLGSVKQKSLWYPILVMRVSCHEKACMRAFLPFCCALQQRSHALQFSKVRKYWLKRTGVDQLSVNMPVYKFVTLPLDIPVWWKVRTSMSCPSWKENAGNIHECRPRWLNHQQTYQLADRWTQCPSSFHIQANSTA